MKPTAVLKASPLITQAIASCQIRGHVMNEFFQVSDPSNMTTSCKCALCGMECFVVEKPAPNETEISGEAVALTCKGYKTK